MRERIKLIFALWKNTIFIVVIPFMVIFSITIYTTHVLQDKTLEQNAMLSEQAMNVIGEKINIINKFVSQLSARSDILRFASMDRSKGSAFYGEMFQIKDIFRNYNNLFDYGNMLLWFDRNDVCITSHSICTDVQGFYGTLMEFESLSLTEFMDEVGRFRLKTGFLPYQSLRFGKESFEGVFYHCQLYPDSPSAASFFLIIDKQYLDSLFAPFSGSQIYLLTGENQMVYGFQADIEHIAPFIQNDGIDLKGLEKGYIVTEIDSPYGLKYLCITSKDMVLKKVQLLYMLTTVLGIGMIAVAIVVSFTMAFHDSKLVSEILSHVKTELQGRQNIFELIRGAVLGLLTDNKQLKESVDSTNSILKKEFFSNLLAGGFGRLYDIQLYARDLKIQMGENHVLIVLSADWVSADISYEDIKKFKGFFYSWYDTLSGSLPEGYLVPVAVGRIAAVLPSEGNPARRAELMMKQADGHLGGDPILLRACVTPSQIPIPELPHAAGRCGSMLNQKSFVSDTDREVCTLDKEKTSRPGRYVFSDERQGNLFTAIRAGDSAAARELFDGLFQEALKYSETDAGVKKEFLSRIRHTFFLSGGQAASFQEELSCTDEMCLSSTLYYYLTGMLEGCCRSNREQQGDHGSAQQKEFLQKVQEFIDGDLSNPNLSLKYLAGKFGFAPTYFSALFKENMGETLSSYLEGRRMQEAGKLLAAKEKNLEEIALECGYANTNTFRRTYKRYYGLNPSQARSLQETET